MRLFVLLTAFLAAGLVHAAPDDLSKPRIVRLKSGKRIAGRVVRNECTNEVLVMRDIRSNAKRTVKWSDVVDKKAHELRVELGFEVEEARGGMRIKAHEIVTKAGAKFTGLLRNAKTAQRDGAYVLKTAEGERRIRIGDVRSGPTEVEVEALVVYTPQELYQQKLAQKAPETAEDHFKLAEFAALVGALKPAKTHYEKVLELAHPKYPPELVNRHLARVNRRLANAEAEAALRDVKKSIVYNQFKRAAQKIAAFKEKYKDDEGLLEDVARLEQDLGEERQDYFTGAIPKLVRSAVKDMLNRKVKEPELTLRMATQYAGGETSDENSASYAALVAVGQKLGIEPQEVLDFWKLRTRRTIYKAFFRDGTFIVLENLQDALAKAPKVPSGKGKSAPKPPKPRPIKTPDGWWNGKLKAKKYTQARDWLYAWWAEKSGMVDLMDPKQEICQTCVGKGYTQHLHQSSLGAIPFFDRCTTCHMSKHFRVVRFK